MLLVKRLKPPATRFASTTSSAYTADILLTPENRARCLKCLQKMSPLGLRPRKAKADVKYASVLIPVCIEENGQLSILYTRRSSLLSRHTRQISFPGGIKDPEDASFEDCALRETEEEIGLPRARVEIWGSGPMIRPPHTAVIMPVYGIVKNLKIEELVINEAEVEEAFKIPIQRLACPTSFHHTQYKDGYSSPVFIVDQYRIWGITGYITNNFLLCFLSERESCKRPKVEFIRPYKPK